MKRNSCPSSPGRKWDLGALLDDGGDDGAVSPLCEEENKTLRPAYEKKKERKNHRRHIKSHAA